MMMEMTYTEMGEAIVADEIYDVIIIGGGASGMTTAIYSARAGLKTLVIEKELYGGQMQSIDLIENYSGFDTISGEDLSEKMFSQMMNYDVEYKNAEVFNIARNVGQTIITTVYTTIGWFETKSVVIATGVKHKELDYVGNTKWKQLHCATCDGFMYKDKDVLVVGGGNSALTEALELSNVVKSVTIVHRRNEFRAEKILVDKVLSRDNITVLYNYVLDLAFPDASFVVLKSTDETSLISSRSFHVDGIFTYVGVEPQTDYLDSLKPDVKESDGYVNTYHDLSTDVVGVFAVGDVRSSSPRQIATAVGDGAHVVKSIKDFIEWRELC